MASTNRDVDDFDLARRAEARIYEAELKRLSENSGENFRPVTHDECIYRAAVIFLKTATTSPRDLLTSITDDPSITEDERQYLQSLERIIKKESAELSGLVKKALPVAQKLEREHLSRVERVSKALSKEDLKLATLCYPVTLWNLERYCWRLVYHLDIENIVEVIQLLSRLPSEYQWLRQAFRRVTAPALIMCFHNRNTAWDLAVSNFLGVPMPSSDQGREQLQLIFEKKRVSLAAAQAEVHFGQHSFYRGFPRSEIGDIADDLAAAGQTEFLDEIDHYAERLKETVFFEELSINPTGLTKGLVEKCQQIVKEKMLFRRGGYRPREEIVSEIGYDPYLALLYDIIDEADKTGTTLKKLADKEDVPVKDLYNLKRRRKYEKKHNK